LESLHRDQRHVANYERIDMVCYKQWMRAAIPYIAVLIAIGIAIWFAVGNPLQP
jgi:hypothetical protein